jgi:hypothetical protein
LAHSLLRERSEAPNIGPIEPWVGLHCALRQIRMADVRFGSLADIEVLPTDVRFTPVTVRVRQDVDLQLLIDQRLVVVVA